MSNGAVYYVYIMVYKYFINSYLNNWNSGAIIDIIKSNIGFEPPFGKEIDINIKISMLLISLQSTKEHQ